MSDLDKMIAAVEAGTATDFRALLTDSDNSAERAKRCGWAASAFKGSLDAAKRLHDALLPGWAARPQIGGGGAGVTVWHCTLEYWDSGAEIDANNMPDPARAWLLAILKALRAERVMK